MYGRVHSWHLIWYSVSIIPSPRVVRDSPPILLRWRAMSLTPDFEGERMASRGIRLDGSLRETPQSQVLVSQQLGSPCPSAENLYACARTV